MRRALLFLVVCLALPSLPAAAGGLGDLLGQLRDAARAARAASHYARTDNPDLAAVELDRAREAWAGVEAIAAAGAPEPFGDEAFAAEVTAFAGALAEAQAALERGDAAAAHGRLERALARLAAARRARGIVFYADCIEEMNAAMDRLWGWRREAERADLADPATADAVKADAAVTLYLYERCRERAPEEVRDASFARLFDGAIASLRRVPEAVNAGQTGRLVSILRELRSYDRLLRFRYG